MSITIVRQTYDERVNMYLKRNKKDTLVQLLLTQDSYFKDSGKIEVLSEEEYRKKTKQQLAEILSKRSVVLFPDSCTECKGDESNIETSVSSTIDKPSTTTCHFNKDELEVLNRILTTSEDNKELVIKLQSKIDEYLKRF